MAARDIRKEIRAALRINMTTIGNRVYPLIMPQDTKENAIVYTVLDDTDQTGLCIDPYAKNYFIQVDIFCKTYAQSVAVSLEAKAALRANFTISNMRSYEMYEDITLKYRQVITFEIINV